LRLEEGATANVVQTTVLPLERIMTTGAIALGAWIALLQDSPIYIGGLVAFWWCSHRVVQPLIQLSHLVQQFDEAQLAVATIANLVNRPAEEASNKGGLKTPLRGHIDFENVRFSYPGSSTRALDDISFRVPENSVLGIVGRSGSGKTTITRILQRLNDGYSGLVRVGGVDIREFDLAYLRANTGVVLQETFLFSGTVRENIAISKPDADLEEIIRAARLAGADSFIEKLPAGYGTVLKEGASNLSGGQKQRIAIARALLRDPQILIFDEATSSLDAESEAIIQANFPRIAQGRTVILISHRLTSLLVADAILVIDEGRKVGHATHRELLEHCEPYARLWHQQSHLREIRLHDEAIPFRARSL
jgi:ATP-binding cassette subfamily B protein